jgi:hypothetical protein
MEQPVAVLDAEREQPTAVLAAEGKQLVAELAVGREWQKADLAVQGAVTVTAVDLQREIGMPELLLLLQRRR